MYFPILTLYAEIFAVPFRCSISNEWDSFKLITKIYKLWRGCIVEMKIAFVYDVYPWIKGAEEYFEKYPTLAEWLNLLEISVENLERGKISYSC